MITKEPLSEAALAYGSIGWHVFPCAVDKKIPACPNGFKDATTDPEQTKRWWADQPYNIGIATGASGLVVVDFDLVNGVPVGETNFKNLPEYEPLPETFTIRTRSCGKQFYFRTNRTGIKSSNSQLCKNVDIKALGGYVIAPPSFVKADDKASGGQYTIENSAKPAQLPVWLELKLLDLQKPKLPKPKTLLSLVPQQLNYFPCIEVNKEKLRKAVRNWLKTEDCSSESAWVQMLFAFRSLKFLVDWTDEEAWGLFDEICKWEGMGKYNYSSNRARWDVNDFKLDGITYKTLLDKLTKNDAEPHEYPVLEFDKGPDSLDQIDELNSKFAWVYEEMNLYDIDRGRFVLKDRFVTQYANQRFNVGTSLQPKLVSLGQAWVTNERRRNAPRVVMAPEHPATLPDGSINSWKGFTCVSKAGDVRPFIDLLKRLIPDVNERRYVLIWLAYLVQNPEARFFVALVIWSLQQGTGKNLLFETVTSLFNKRHTKVVGQEVFNDGFTDWQAHKVVVICDEVSSTDKRSTSDRIKGWITATDNTINAKNEPKFTQDNLIKYIFLSNHADAVFLNETDRRFFVVEATSTRLPSDFADEYVKWRDSDGRSALRNYLVNINTKEFNPKAPAPSSNAKREMVEDNKSDLERWVDETLEQYQAKEVLLVNAQTLSKQYSEDNKSSCSSKTTANILRTKGLQKITKQARLENGRKIRLHVRTNYESYNNMSDSELGAEYIKQQIKLVSPIIKDIK
jgi:hypothetical protein